MLLIFRQENKTVITINEREPSALLTQTDLKYILDIWHRDKESFSPYQAVTGSPRFVSFSLPLIWNKVDIPVRWVQFQNNKSMTSLSWQAWGPWNGYTSILNCTQVHHLSEYIFIVVFHYWIVFMPCWRAVYVKVEMLWMHISRGLNSVLGHSILNGVWYNTCSSVESDTPQPGSLSLSLLWFITYQPS